MITSHKKKIWWLIATWFGSGLSPVMSGTAGSLAALPFALVIHFLFGALGLFLSALFMFALGVWASNEYLRHNPENQDPGQIVADEVAGQWLTLSFLALSPLHYAVGFVLFRAFDIIKPWPVSWADSKVKGGMGVMLDDIIAGVLAGVLGMALLHFFGS